ncbi:RidA family protein [Nostoc sp. CHAB 5784]|uniref:RidA family protein n=1 Tax=Nostoc mirabile TaxID=2907820 RepID=UPI001E460B39|nr:RidA family protein [Nostoc mirabile]MCC5670415.1 RidA family protein [Nostoc mirabile CHAB5784]
MTEIQKINPETWQDKFAFSQAIEVKEAHRVLYCAGQTPVDLEGKPQHANDIRLQISLALENVERILIKSGYNLADVVRLNIYTCDMDATLKNYDVLAQRLQSVGCQPSSSLIGVTRLAIPEVLVEIEATAAK